ncbi:MAG: insulinase family protein [Gammaproteobacteria bacterium]|nr:insulinase family protein [Gammaproteobacteria bacterium]
MRSRFSGTCPLAGLLVLSALLAACGGADKAPDAKATAGQATAGTDRIFDIPYLVRDLDNGLRVIVVPTDYPDIVSIQIPVQTGSRNEVEPGKSGFAHFFEHMMFRGTEAYPAQVYADILKKAGADQNAYTSDDYTNYHITFTKADLEKVIELEADRFQRLKYSEEQFRTEALAVKGEYLKNFSNPIQKMFERVSDLMYEKHTYKHTTMGYIEDIEAMPEQMEYANLFFDRWYRPEKTVVILVGDVDAEETFALVEKYWGDWEQGDYEVDIPVEPPLAGPKYEHLPWDGPTQPWLVMAYRGPAYVPTEKDMPALDLISSIYFSESSDLYQKLVIQDQAVDQLFGYFPDQKDPGMLLIAARLTDVANAVNVRDYINKTLAEARTQLVPDSRIEETKSRLRYGFTSGLDNSSGIAEMLARIVHFSRTPETINEVYRTYDTLTASDVREIANKYFVDSQRVTFTLSNDDGIAGIDGKASVDALVAAAGMAAAPTGAGGGASIVELPAVAAAEMTPVAFVAQQSATSPLVDVAFLIHTGAGFDPKGKKGLAVFTAAMLTDGGSEAMSIEQINRAMYPIASGFYSQVDKEMTRLSGQVHKDNLAAWYELVRGQLLFPAWSQSDFDRIKTQLKNAIRTDLIGNNDEELAKEALYTSIYGGDHPYGSLTLGTISDLDTITLEDIKQFYRDNYTIANTTVGLAGGYPDEFATTISNDMQKLAAGERRELALPPAPMRDGRRALLIEKETPAVAVSFGFPIELKRGDPDWVALWLARSYLGEHRSVNSHLYQRIRETRGMNYGDYAYIEYFPRGMFQFHPDTNLAREQQIFQVWIRPLRSNGDAHFATRTAMFEIEKLVEEGISESDFETTRAYLSKFVSLLMDGQSRQLGYALDSQYYQTGNFAEYVRDGLENLTLADVNRVIRENLVTDDIQYAYVTNDAEDLRRRLVSDQDSPMRYAADKPQELLDEDAVISRIPLGLAEDKVEVVSAEEVFN